MNILRPLLLVMLFGSMAFAADEPLNATQAADRVILPKVDFRGATLEEAIEFLARLSEMKANQSARPNVILAVPPGPRAKITLQRQNESMLAALKAVAEQADCEVHREAHALVVREKGAPPLPEIILGAGANGNAISAKLDQIIIPRADFRNSTVREAIEFLVQKMKQLDPDGAGVSVVMKLGNEEQPGAKPGHAAANIPGIPGLPPSSATPAPPAPVSTPFPAPAAPGVPGLPDAAAVAPQGPRRISMRVSNMPILELFRYATGLGDLQVTIQDYAIVISAPAKK